MQLKETVQVIVRKGEQRWLADLEWNFTLVLLLRKHCVSWAKLDFY
jgi:hypothetical protein